MNHNEDKLPERTAAEIEQFRRDEDLLGNRAVPPWDARETAWRAREKARQDAHSKNCLHDLRSLATCALQVIAIARRGAQTQDERDLVDVLDRMATASHDPTPEERTQALDAWAATQHLDTGTTTP